MVDTLSYEFKKVDVLYRSLLVKNESLDIEKRNLELNYKKKVSYWEDKAKKNKLIAIGVGIGSTILLILLHN